MTLGLYDADVTIEQENKTRHDQNADASRVEVSTTVV